MTHNIHCRYTVHSQVTQNKWFFSRQGLVFLFIFEFHKHLYTYVIFFFIPSFLPSIYGNYVLVSHHFATMAFNYFLLFPLECRYKTIHWNTMFSSFWHWSALSLFSSSRVCYFTCSDLTTALEILFVATTLFKYLLNFAF